MRIETIQISGFGHFRDYEISHLSPGLTLFEGQNEAGKSTLMAFVRAMLFGFEGRKSGLNRYEPKNGGRHGGTLTLLNDQGESFVVQRTEGGAYGRIKVSSSDGQSHGGEVLHTLLSGTSKTLFQNVFAFGLSELQRLESLQDDEVNHHIYTAGMGTGAVPYTEVLQQLEYQQGQLFKPGGKKPVVNVLLAKLDETQRTIAKLQTLPDEYQRVQADLEALERTIPALKQAHTAVQQRVQWLDVLVKARPIWDRLQEVRLAIKDYATVSSFPEGGLERLTQWNNALAQLQQRESELVDTLESLDQRESTVTVDPGLLQQETFIRALEAECEHVRKQQELLPHLAKKLREKQEDLETFLKHIGPDWDITRLESLQHRLPERKDLTGFRQRLDTAGTQAAQIAREAETARTETETIREEGVRLQSRLQPIEQSLPSEGLTLEEREQAVRDWVQEFHQLDLLLQHQKDVQELGVPVAAQVDALEGELSLLDRQKGLPLWLIILVGLAFGTLGLFTVSQNQMLLAIAILASGVLTTGLLLWRRDSIQNERHMREAEIQQQHVALLGKAHSLQQKADTASRTIRQAMERLKQWSLTAVQREMKELGEAQHVWTQLQQERLRLEKCKELKAHHQDIQDKLARHTTALETLQNRLRETESDFQERQREWKHYLADHALDTDLTPESALELVALLETAKAHWAEWRESIQAHQRVEDELEDFSRRVNEFLADQAKPLIERREAVGTVLQLRDVLEESVAASRSLAGFRVSRQEKEEELNRIRREMADGKDRITALMAEAGAKDDADFQQRAKLFKQQLEWTHERQRLESAMKALAGTDDRLAELEEHLTNRQGPAVLEEYHQVGDQAFQDSESRLNETLQEKGRLLQQLNGMERDEQLAAALLEKQTFLAQLDRTVHQWAVYATTRFLLEKARQIYERERQPAVLRHASEFFSDMTQGRYQRVLVPLGESRLEVEEKDGVTQGTERLSRGTAEQLYLSMRLAFVCEYAAHAGLLPLIMDDILVNFDPERAKAAIRVLKNMTNSHQILFFTCHPHVSDWFKEIIPDVSIRSLATH